MSDEVIACVCMPLSCQVKRKTLTIAASLLLPRVQLDDYDMVTFVPCDVTDEETLEIVLQVGLG